MRNDVRAANRPAECAVRRPGGACANVKHGPGGVLGCLDNPSGLLLAVSGPDHQFSAISDRNPSRFRQKICSLS